MTLTEAKSLLVRRQEGVWLTAEDVEAILSVMERPSEDEILREAALTAECHAQDWRRRAERAEARIAAMHDILNGLTDSPNPASAPADPLPPSVGAVLGEGGGSGAGRDASGGTTANGSHEAAGSTPLGAPVAKPDLDRVAAPLPAKPPRKRKAPAPISTAIQCGGPDCTLAGNVEHHKPSSCPRFTKAKEPSDAR